MSQWPNYDPHHGDGHGPQEPSREPQSSGQPGAPRVPEPNQANLGGPGPYPGPPGMPGPYPPRQQVPPQQQWHGSYAPGPYVSAPYAARRTSTGCVVATAVVAGLGLLLLLAILGSVFLARRPDPAPVPSSSATASQTASAPYDGRPPNGTMDRTGIIVNPGKSPSGSPLVIVYSDYQCPHCATFELTYGPVLQEMADSGEIQLRQATMTFMDANRGNQVSTQAAEAAACADDEGKYRAFHKALFQAIQRDPNSVTNATIKSEIAPRAGIRDSALFDTCVDRRSYQGFVRDVDANSSKAGIASTPTVTVKGKPLDLKQLNGDPESLRAAIKAML